MHPRLRQLLTVLGLGALASVLFYLNVRVQPPAIPKSSLGAEPVATAKDVADAGPPVHDDADLGSRRRQTFANRSMKDELVAVARVADELKPALMLLDNLNCDRGLKARDALLNDASTRPEYASLLDAYAKATCGDRLAAIALLQKELLHALGASHKTLQTWHQLRQLGVSPGADGAQEVLGLVIDVATAEGTDTTAVYSDGTWERIGAGLGSQTRDAGSAQAKEVARQLVSDAAPFIKSARKEADIDRPVNAGFTRFTFLTPGGPWMTETLSSDLATGRHELSLLRSTLLEFQRVTTPGY